MKEIRRISIKYSRAQNTHIFTTINSNPFSLYNVELSGTKSSTGKLDDGFTLTLANVLGGQTIILGELLEVTATWAVTGLDDVSFYFDNCGVVHGAKTVNVIQGSDMKNIFSTNFLHQKFFFFFTPNFFLFFTQKFFLFLHQFFTPNFFLFLHQFFTPNFFLFLHQFFTPIFFLFLHQHFVFLHQTFSFVTPIFFAPNFFFFYTNIFFFAPIFFLFYTNILFFCTKIFPFLH